MDSSPEPAAAIAEPAAASAGPAAASAGPGSAGPARARRLGFFLVRGHSNIDSVDEFGDVSDPKVYFISLVTASNACYSNPEFYNTLEEYIRLSDQEKIGVSGKNIVKVFRIKEEK